MKEYEIKVRKGLKESTVFLGPADNIEIDFENRRVSIFNIDVPPIEFFISDNNQLKIKSLN